MHEVGVMQETLAIALEKAALRGAGRIHRIALRIGPLSGIDPDAITFAFDVVSQGTIAEGGELMIERVPVRCHCPACGLDYQPEPVDLICPRCERPGARIEQGRELELAYLEVSSDES